MTQFLFLTFIFLMSCSEKIIIKTDRDPDQKEMIDCLSTVERAPKKVFLVHGENSSREAFRIKILDVLKWNVGLPQMQEEILLFDVH